MKMPILTLKDFCAVCGKGPTSGFTRPHSLHKTKKVIRPNLGKWGTMMVCASCRKSLSKPDHIRKTQTKGPVSQVQA